MEGAGDDPEARAEFLESSGQQIERLDWLAQNLLELSKLDSGLVLLDLRPDDLRAAVEIGRRADRRRRPGRRGVALSARACPTRPLRIRHDPQRIGQVVANLVGNAIKFTPRGGSVTGRPRARPRRARGSRSPTPASASTRAELPHIFERFYRGSRANEARGSGSGLGLAIVRSIVDMHGGTIVGREPARAGVHRSRSSCRATRGLVGRSDAGGASWPRVTASADAARDAGSARSGSNVTETSPTDAPAGESGTRTLSGTPIRLPRPLTGRRRQQGPPTTMTDDSIATRGPGRADRSATTPSRRSRPATPVPDARRPADRSGGRALLPDPRGATGVDPRARRPPATPTPERWYEPTPARRPPAGAPGRLARRDRRPGRSGRRAGGAGHRPRGRAAVGGPRLRRHRPRARRDRRPRPPARPPRPARPRHRRSARSSPSPSTSRRRPSRSRPRSARPSSASRSPATPTRRPGRHPRDRRRLRRHLRQQRLDPHQPARRRGRRQVRRSSSRTAASFAGTVYGIDTLTDLAIVKIDGHGPADRRASATRTRSRSASW